MTAAATIAGQCQRLAERTAAWSRTEPSPGEVLDVAERLAELVRRVDGLGAGEELGVPARTAAALAVDVATTARALRVCTLAWSQYLPPLDAMHGVQRLSAELARSLAALSRLHRELPDELAD